MTSKTSKPAEPALRPAEIVREYGPFPDTDTVAGVTHDGKRVWAATGKRLIAFDPASGDPTDSLPCPCDAGTACLLYTSPSPRDRQKSRMPSSA